MVQMKVEKKKTLAGERNTLYIPHGSDER